MSARQLSVFLVFVIFDRSARIPIDALFNHDENHFKDVSSPADYAEVRSFILKDVFDIVAKNFQLNSEKMPTHYNKNICFHDYRSADKVWLNLKYYKTGETRKLSPRRHGYWTVLRELPNGTKSRFKETSNAENSGSDLKDQHHRPVAPKNELLLSGSSDSSESETSVEETLDSDSSDITRPIQKQTILTQNLKFSIGSILGEKDMLVNILITSHGMISEYREGKMLVCTPMTFMFV